METLLNALRETLAKLGLDEQAIEAALQEAVAKAEGEENPSPDGDPLPNPPEGDVPPLPPDVPVDDVPSDVPPSADLPTDDVPPTEGEPVPPTDPVPPVEPDVPAVPPFDPTPLLEQVNALQGQLDEYKKANEGLLARVQSLEDSLKAAGVIDGSVASEVGDALPGAAPQSPTDDVFGSVLNELNCGRRY